MADDNDNPQLHLGDIITNLSAVRAARKANTLSRVHRRLIEPIETDQDNEPRLSFQHTVFCQAGLPYRNPGDDVREWQREQAMNPKSRKYPLLKYAIGSAESEAEIKKIDAAREATQAQKERWRLARLAAFLENKV